MLWQVYRNALGSSQVLISLQRSIVALATRHSGHRVRVQNRRPRILIPPGCKVLGLYSLQCCRQNLICIVIVCI
jgi:hypothetical protein